MPRSWWSNLRRWVATAVLLSGGVPAALELTHHAEDGVQVAHVEAATTNHHVDHCVVGTPLLAQAVSSAQQPSPAAFVDPVRAGCYFGPMVFPAARLRAHSSRAPPVHA
ncbi:MAG: hypothetical protein EXR94_12630 [Gemmatimonadetes bacterium]|nr:hypothetical protein [Gemmatimonadota bacterium]